jgi:hypothetical protein
MNKLPLAPQDHNPDSPPMCARRRGHLAGPWTPQYHKICRSEHRGWRRRLHWA